MDKTDKILVTGGTGFVGSYILRSLLDSGFHNILATKRSNSNMSLVSEIMDQVDWTDVDILDIVSLDLIMPEVDAIVHAAAMVSFDPSDKDQVLKVNAEGTANLVNAALEWGVRRFIHISSIATIATKSPKELIDEEDPREDSRHDSDYTISKQKAEMEVWRGGGEGLSIGILNPSLILGSGFWNRGSANMFRQIQKGLAFYPPGTNGFVDVRDVARATCKLLDSSIENQRFIISAENLTYQDLFGRIADGLSVKKPFIALNPILSETSYWISRIIGWFHNDPVLVSRSTLRNASRVVRFNNRKSVKMLGLNYTPISQTINDTTHQLSEAAQNDFQACVLSIN